MLIDNDDYEYEYEFTNNDYDLDYVENTYNHNKYNTYSGPNYVYNFRPATDLTSMENGFLRGNMFNSVYDNFYKRIKKISTSNERERLLLQIQQLTFESIDLTLYLDVYPNDRHEIYNELNKQEVYENTLNFISVNI